MHIQILDKFYRRVFKILSGNEIMRDERMDRRNDRQPKSSIARTFSKRGYNKSWYFYEVSAQENSNETSKSNALRQIKKKIDCWQFYVSRVRVQVFNKIVQLFYNGLSITGN